jgi:hypothetical protein
MRFRYAIIIILIPSTLFMTVVTSGNDAGFALHLYRSGDFAAASVELKRFIFSHPEDRFVPYARYLEAVSRARGGEYEKALQELLKLIDELSAGTMDKTYPLLQDEAKLQVLNILFRQKRFRDYYLYRERFAFSDEISESIALEYIKAMDVAIPVYNFKWNEALQCLKKERFRDEKLSKLIEERLFEAQQHRLKKPAIGGLLSVFPGAGHIYAGRLWDGVRSFFINAGVASLSIFCFTMGIPVIGVLFGIIEAFLYASCIYGGVNAVLQENARYQVGLRDELLRYISVPPLDPVILREEFGLR